MPAVTELAVDVGTSAACQALAMPRASYYRARRKISSPRRSSRGRYRHVHSVSPNVTRS